MYQAGYESHLDIITEYIRSFENLQAMGRYGMFKYNNADQTLFDSAAAMHQDTPCNVANKWCDGADLDQTGSVDETDGAFMAAAIGCRY